MNRGKVIGLVLIVAGIFLCLESTLSATGYVVLNESLENSFALGGLFLLISGSILFFLFEVGRARLERDSSGIENKVISSRVKEDTHLLKIAKDVGKKEKISRDINHLLFELNRGNINPGLGTQHITEGIYEMRGRRGGRVFYREINPGKFEILAYSDKDKQSKVIEYLRNKYAHGY